MGRDRQWPQGADELLGNRCVTWTAWDVGPWKELNVLTNHLVLAFDNIGPNMFL